MNHYPFEEWLFEEHLSVEEEKQLKEHLTQCVECCNLRKAINETDQIFSNIPLAEPESRIHQPVGGLCLSKRGITAKSLDVEITYRADLLCRNKRFCPAITSPFIRFLFHTNVHKYVPQIGRQC